MRFSALLITLPALATPMLSQAIQPLDEKTMRQGVGATPLQLECRQTADSARANALTHATLVSDQGKQLASQPAKQCELIHLDQMARQQLNADNDPALQTKGPVPHEQWNSPPTREPDVKANPAQLLEIMYNNVVIPASEFHPLDPNFPKVSAPFR